MPLPRPARSRRRRRRAALPLAVIAVTGILTGGLAGCTAQVDAAADPVPAPTPTATAPMSPHDPAYDVVPEPGRTIEASPPAQSETLVGYRIAVVSAADSEATSTLVHATREFADATGASLEEHPAASAASDDIDEALFGALEAEPDLILGLGAEIVDVFSFETAQWADPQFLILGAQIAEPTDNVTAVIWDGATSRGAAAAPDGPLSDAAVAAEHGRAALAAGVESVREGVTGVVLSLPTAH